MPNLAFLGVEIAERGPLKVPFIFRTLGKVCVPALQASVRGSLCASRTLVRDF